MDTNSVMPCLTHYRTLFDVRSLTLRFYDSTSYFFHQCFIVPQEAEQKVASELQDLGKTAAEYKECFEQLTKGLCCLCLVSVTHLKD